MSRATLIGGLAALGVCGFFVMAAIVSIDGPDTSGSGLPELKPEIEPATAAADAPRSSKPRSAKPVVQTELVTRAQIVAARRYARSRGAGVSFAVIDAPGGRSRGLHKYAEYPSASVSKAMMMVAVLRH